MFGAWFLLSVLSYYTSLWGLWGSLQDACPRRAQDVTLQAAPDLCQQPGAHLGVTFTFAVRTDSRDPADPGQHFTCDHRWAGVGVTGPCPTDVADAASTFPSPGAQAESKAHSDSHAPFAASAKSWPVRQTWFKSQLCQ